MFQQLMLNILHNPCSVSVLHIQLLSCESVRNIFSHCDALSRSCIQYKLDDGWYFHPDVQNCASTGRALSNSNVIVNFHFFFSFTVTLKGFILSLAPP